MSADSSAHSVGSASDRLLFGRTRADEIYSGRSMLQSWLDVEAALARSVAALGLIPKDAATEISHNAHVDRIDADGVLLEMDSCGHSILPLLRALRHACGPRAAEYVHWGATSQDIIDTAQIIQLRRAVNVIYRELRTLEGTLIAIAHEHRGTMMIGRTLGQHALPITFGFRVATWVAELRRHVARLVHAAPTVFVGTVAGAVGTFASFGGHGRHIQQLTLTELGLGVPPISWHTSRDALVEQLTLLALIATSIENMVGVVHRLMSTDIGELHEPKLTPGTSSSTMAHKSNPIVTEAIIGSCRAVRCDVTTVFASALHDHERGRSGWMLEWDTAPRMCGKLETALRQAIWLFQNLVVDSERMSDNIERTRGLILAEAVMMALAPHIGRQHAHEAVHRLCAHAEEERASLASVMIQDLQVSKLLSLEDIAQLTDPRHYLGEAREVLDATLDFAAAARASDPERL